MTAAPPNTVDLDLSALKRVLIFGFILAVFFVGDNFDFFYKLRTGGNERDATATIATSGGGGSLRPFAFALLGLFGVACWMWRPAGLRAMVHGWLPALMFIFIVYVSLSVLWAEDQEIVLRRVVTFILLCVAAWGMVHRLSNRELMLCCFVVCGAVGVMSVAAEVGTGTFIPWSPEYRLSGIMHANSLGATMAIFVLAALALRRGSERHRNLFLLAAAIGLGIVLLTKSRTAMAGLVVALWIWVVFGARDRKRLVVLSLLGLALVGPVVVFLVGEDISASVRTTVLLGREGNSPETFTGRIPLWEFLISRYLDERPFFGYGFQGFWTPEHILRVSDSQDWLIMHAHSGYLNVVLELGYVGLGLFVLILLLGTLRSYAYFRATRDPGWLFMTALLTWAIVASFFDSHLLSTSLRNFFCTLALAKLALFDPRYVRVRQSELQVAGGAP